MFASVRALLSGIIDYAGLFPPARLPLEQALRNYACYRAGPDSWMLGRFVCPAGRLAELAPFHGAIIERGPPLAISALGSSGDTVEEFLAGLYADLESIAAFRKRHGELVNVEVYEVRLPAELLQRVQDDSGDSSISEAITHFWDSLRDAVDEAGPPSLTPFLEMPFVPLWRQLLDALTAVLANVGPLQHAIETPGCRPGGIKMRCGGLEAKAFPSPDEVAGAITTCRERGVSLKATAGLHHPMRHFDAGLKAHTHGFLNVFGAAVLTFAESLGEREVRAVIEDEEPRNFVFSDGDFRWQDYAAETAKISAARREFITSFGSCSFEEPRDDLRAIGLVP